MAWFRNRLYIGTARNTLCLAKRPNRAIPPAKMDFWPVYCPEPEDAESIWRGDKASKIGLRRRDIGSRRLRGAAVARSDDIGNPATRGETRWNKRYPLKTLVSIPLVVSPRFVPWHTVNRKTLPQEARGSSGGQVAKAYRQVD